MKFRQAAALGSLLLVAGCSPNMTSMNASTRAAEASAERAETAAKIAEASAQDALNTASRATFLGVFSMERYLAQLTIGPALTTLWRSPILLMQARNAGLKSE